MLIVVDCAGEEEAVEVGEACTTVAELKHAVSVALPHLKRDTFDVQLPGATEVLHEDDSIGAFEDGTRVAVLPCKRQIARSTLHARGLRWGCSEDFRWSQVTGNAKECALFLAAGASPTTGKPLLEFEVLRHAAVVRLLVQAGASVNGRSKSRRFTPLHCAALHGLAAAAGALLEGGAETEKKDDVGDTPLHNAARGGHTEAVRVLLEHGADPTAENDEGTTPEEASRHLRATWSLVSRAMRGCSLTD